MFKEGQQIGPYTLIRRLGKGGFGDVWLAERRSQFLTKKVAVKLPHDDQVDFNTIQREAGLWEEASGHPNVLPIIDAEVYEGQVVIVSEYADGGSLADKLTDLGTTSVREAVDLTMGILSGLEFLHGKRIIHRDIKPQNILLQGNTPRLADFGISRAMATSAVSSTIIGTDAYMSPEAFDGKRTEATDIWSTGVVLYQLLNGTLPFPQTHPTERMFAVLTKDFEPLAETVPSDLRQIVATALAKLPENRFRSAAEMREALGHAKVRIDHPTFANTEVFDPVAMPVFPPQTPEGDPEATVIRVQIPTEQETFVRPAAPEPPPSTQLAFLSESKQHEASKWNSPNRPDDPTSTPFSAGPTKPVYGYEKAASFLMENPLVGIMGAVMLGIGAVIFFGVMASSGVSSSKNANNSKSLTNNYNFNNANYTTRTPTPSPSPSPSPTSGGLYTDGKGDSYCEGWDEGFEEGWKQVKGGDSTVPAAPKCPASPENTNYDAGFYRGVLEGTSAARKK